MSHIYIVGAGSLAKEIEFLCGYEHETVAFLSENPEEHGKVILDKPCVGDPSILKPLPYVKYIVGIGDPKTRKRIVEQLGEEKLYYPVIAESNNIGAECDIGDGTVMFPNVWIGPDAKIGKNCIIYPNTTIHHDSIIGDNSVVCAGVSIAGNVKIGSECWIGIGSTIKEKVSVAPGTTLGAGACLVDSVTLPGQTLVGVPAKPHMSYNYTCYRSAT